MRILSVIIAAMTITIALGVALAAAPPPPAPPAPPPPPPPPVPPVPPPPPHPHANVNTVLVVVTPSNFTKIFDEIRTPNAVIYVLKPEYSSALIVMKPGIYKVLDNVKTYVVFKGKEVTIVSRRAVLITNVLASIDTGLTLKGLGLDVEAVVAYAHPHENAEITLVDCVARSVNGEPLVLESYAEDGATTVIKVNETKLESSLKLMIVAKTPSALSEVELLGGAIAPCMVRGGVKAIGFGPGTKELELVKCSILGQVFAKYLTLLYARFALLGGLKTIAVNLVNLEHTTIGLAASPIPKVHIIIIS